jgi:hypothetical protein
MAQVSEVIDEKKITDLYNKQYPVRVNKNIEKILIRF